jgi:hypothetical protein
MSVYAGPEIVNSGIGFFVDFSNSKSINGTTLTDISSNKIPVSLTNPLSNTLSIENGYAVFSPSDVGATATFYTISNSYFNTIKNEMSLETCMYAFQNFGDNQYVRGVSPRTTETGSPLGFSIGSSNITAEVNTNLGWNVSSASSSLIGYNKWVFVTQTTSVIENSFKTYINGQLILNRSLNGGIPNGGNGILIGRGFYAGIRNYSGRVSFVRVYNRALTAQEIQQNFNATRSRYGI